MAVPSDPDAYDRYIEQMRNTEYPMLQDGLYLDHAGTTLYSKTLMERFHRDMMSTLYGNPHSASPSSQRSTLDIETVRLQALRYFGADPDDFDLVFTANTTAAIKLVMEAFREQAGSFSYAYHVDSHTSLVGVREAAKDHRCLESDQAAEQWLQNDLGDRLRLFAYPAQSNMTGRRLPRNWPQMCPSTNIYTLLDAAASVTTSPLRLGSFDIAPDFTVVSFSKIFGFPDLGALIVKKNTAHLFQNRRYFGGGTVDMVLCLKEHWHAMKSTSLHVQLEDGTLPIHSILALRAALQTHADLFHSLDRVAMHTSTLVKRLYDGLSSLKHVNRQDACKFYGGDQLAYSDSDKQGPTVAFNLQDSRGQWVSIAEVEKLAAIKDIHLRTGGLCNPGGMAKSLDLAPWEMLENFSAGFRCGTENDLMNGKPTGVIRVSLGAMSTKSDVDRFVEFVDEYFVDKTAPNTGSPSPLALNNPDVSGLYVESLTVYPIKSCGGWQVPWDTPWDVHREGLAWDREWCIVKQGTGVALSQKAHPRMALIRPILDFREGILRIKYSGSNEQIQVPLSKDPSYFSTADFQSHNASVCGDGITAHLYTSKAIANFLTLAIGVPCTLARFPAPTQASPSARHSKAHLQHASGIQNPRPILFSNESPILTITRSSLNRLNEVIKAKGGKAAHPAVFRANIVLSEDPFQRPGYERPYAEDDWQGMRIGGIRGPKFEFLGGCRRCQMVCVDQESGEKDQEPFVTLSKTRRFEGRVLFGVHTSLTEGRGGCGTISVGDQVETWHKHDDRD